MSAEEQITIRIARADDNEELIRLAQACPQKGSLHMYTDRYPDFFAMNRIQSANSRIYVAENSQGKIVASVSFAEKNERYKGEDIKVLHICDIRTHPDYRRTKAAAEFITLYEKTLISENYNHGIAEILEGNQAIIKAHKYLETNCHIRLDGSVVFSQLVPALKYRVSKAFSYRKAHTADIPQIVGLLNAHYNQVEGYPQVSDEWLTAQLNHHSSFSIEHLWVAVNAQGEIQACAGLWNQSPIRRTVAVKFSPTMKRAIRVLRTLGLIWKLPSLPKEGETLDYSFVRFNVGKNAQSLGALLRFLMNRIRHEGHQQFVVIGFHENDPLKDSIRGLIKAEDRMHVFSHWPRANSETLEGASLYRYCDLSTI